MDYEKKYKEALELARVAAFNGHQSLMEGIFPELKESEDELTWLTKYVEEEAYSLSMDIRDSEDRIKLKKLQKALSWLEKQGSEPNWCHHKVDLSNCSEEYRKAYYDGWNNCNQQHSQCKSEWNDVVKCLINGMKFYYEDNEEATWGTEKFSMKVKDILSWLEKQGRQKPIMIQWQGNNLKEVIDFTGKDKNFEKWFKSFEDYEKYVDDHNGIFKLFNADGSHYEVPIGSWIVKTPDGYNVASKAFFRQKNAWSEEDEKTLNEIFSVAARASLRKSTLFGKSYDYIKWQNWLKSLRPQKQWKPTEEQMFALKNAEGIVGCLTIIGEQLKSLYEDLKKL